MSKQLEQDLKQKFFFIQNYLFDYLDEPGYMFIILTTKGRIAGFTEKNYHKVPKPLLKSTAKRRLKKFKEVDLLFEAYVGDLIERYENTDIDEFLKEVNLSQDITEGQKLTLFYMLYPTTFSEKEQLIKENMNKNSPPLHNIVTLSVKEKMKAILARADEKLSKQINKYLSTHLHHFLEDKTNVLTEIKSIENYLQRASLQQPGSGHYIQLYTKYLQTKKQLNKEESDLFFQLVIQDMIILSKNKFTASEQELDDITSLHSDKKRALQKLNKQKQQLENKLHHMSENFKKLTNKYDELSDDYESKRRQTEQIIKQNTQYAEQIKEKQHKKEQLHSEKAQLLEEQTSINNLTLFDEEKVYLLSRVKNGNFLKYLNEKQIIYYDNVNHLLKKLKQFKKEAIYFINIDGISTKKSFLLERPFKENKLTYRMVGGGPNKVIRTMIFYLESDLKYETKETN